MWDIASHTINGDYLLVYPVDEPDFGGITGAEQYEDKPEFGVIIKSGDKNIKEGDFVVYGKYSSTIVRSQGVDFFFIRSEDVMSHATPSKGS